MSYSSVLDRLTYAQHALYFCVVRRVHQGCTAQLTLTLGRHFGQDVALESVLVLETVSSLLEALRSTTFSLHLWHVRYSTLWVITNNRKACQCLGGYFFFSGAMTTICWLPSIFGCCPTEPSSASSASARFNSSIPSSSCPLSPPRNLKETLALPPSLRTRTRLRRLTW